MPWFMVLAGLWGIAMAAVFIQAIRLSYAVERRSPDLANRTGVPRKAMIFHTMFNLSVARDAGTQAMRRRMNVLLLLNLAGLLLMGAYLIWIGNGS